MYKAAIPHNEVIPIRTRMSVVTAMGVTERKYLTLMFIHAKKNWAPATKSRPRLDVMNSYRFSETYGLSQAKGAVGAGELLSACPLSRRDPLLIPFGLGGSCVDIVSTSAWREVEAERR